MGVKDGAQKLVPLGVWADKSWEDIDKELIDKKPKGILPPVLTIDGEKGQQALGNLAQDIQRCQWHASNQLGYFLWQDGVAKSTRGTFIDKLSGIIKIELPENDYKEISDDMKEEIQEKIKESKKSVTEMIDTFTAKGYAGASTYLNNAAGHLFTVIEKWLEIGYMPPKAISILERTMREMGRRLKKIGASWKDKGLLAIAYVLMTRIYTPQQWKEYWDKLLDLQGRCSISSYHVSLSVISS
jgi:hypothetical protein